MRAPWPVTRRVIVRCAAPSIALVSLIAMSKREPEPLLPVQPQQSAGGAVAVSTNPLLLRLLYSYSAAVPPFRERSERSGPERVPATFRTGANQRSCQLRCSEGADRNGNEAGAWAVCVGVRELSRGVVNNCDVISLPSI